MQNLRPPPTTWWQCEPRRLQRDQEEVRARFPNLEWQDAGAGGWMGRLPRWPFARPEPAGLVDVIGEQGLLVAVVYGHAYPMVAPAVHPVDPQPRFSTRTDQRWHVMGDGSLCLFQDDTTWTGRDSIVELLLKAAGWRVEFELMTRGLINAMTINGIVNDDQLDPLLLRASGETDKISELDGSQDDRCST
ncbi:hypothetical protein DLJ47_32830 [Micromonospora sp. S4605]|uniref:hypothetical protein n=1 Tax=Micromonospora sp. S4605 TaxID=1420897 RepID=UPI000D6EE2A0|nr:hypothetical protein [Micromonospora sp. S4605]PWU46298.1 hypothetical protein DLJ47_32830 [Micromonospora sp. S4605]